MKSFTNLVCVALLLSVLPAASQSLSPKVQEQLDAAEKAMFAATSNGDSSAFRKLSGRDYFTINANGVSQTLEEALPYVPRFKGSTVQLSQQQQRIYGNLALRTGLLKAFINGQLVAEALYTAGWVFRDDRWQFIHWQGTPTGILLEGKGLREPPKNE
ncbi:nuclear transport factor 2 family protein [Paraflavitalea sp. CAU 1676]|uniref:nuclear transport factor 2 family protein n=1 Tax=Paraflavitalea sp. CAU 1676 TaxID=3032598 RepID=UPI0023DA377A|nr:nuclear transport factor 2 family protein [Paraflavitalea sp. CAU 1676]MDF2188361.1 nuclear transport factor 2 family protein [Paraflavitalea sp. CAU 1676]